MPDTAARRKRARMIDALKRAEIALLEAKLESPGEDESVVRSIDNALTGTKWAIGRSATLSPGTKTGPKVIK